MPAGMQEGGIGTRPDGGSGKLFFYKEENSDYLAIHQTDLL